MKKLLLTLSIAMCGMFALTSSTLPSIEPSVEQTSVSEIVSTSEENVVEEVVNAIDWEAWLNSAEGIITLISGSTTLTAIVVAIFAVIKLLASKQTNSNAIKNALAKQQELFENKVVEKLIPLIESNSHNAEQLELLLEAFVLSMENTPSSKVAILELLKNSVKNTSTAIVVKETIEKQVEQETIIEQEEEEILNNVIGD